MLLNRDDWYDISRDLDWELSYVDPAVAFPTSWSGAGDVPKDAWDKWDEPFRVSYRDYVRIQREKESGVKAVSSAWCVPAPTRSSIPRTSPHRICTWAPRAWSSTWR